MISIGARSFCGTESAFPTNWKSVTLTPFASTTSSGVLPNFSGSRACSPISDNGLRTVTATERVIVRFGSHWTTELDGAASITCCKSCWFTWMVSDEFWAWTGNSAVKTAATVSHWQTIQCFPATARLVRIVIVGCMASMLARRWKLFTD